MSGSSTAPRDESAVRRDDTSATDAASVATGRSDADAVTSRPPARPSTAVVDTGAASAGATGSATCTGSAGVGGAATAAAGWGVATATGTTVGCAGAAATGACTVEDAAAAGADGFAPGCGTAAGGGDADAGGTEAGRRGRRLERVDVAVRVARDAHAEMDVRRARHRILALADGADGRALVHDVAA